MKEEKPDLVKSDDLTNFKRTIANTFAAQWTLNSEKLEVEEVGKSLHLAYYLYLNRKVKSELEPAGRGANGS